MKIAIAQLNPTIGDLTGNARAILAAAQSAATQGARLMLTPELSLCGYPPRDLLMQPSFIEAMTTVLHQLARDLPPQLAVLVGMAKFNGRSTLEGGKPLFNSVALLEGGEVRRVFHKRLLPTYDVFDEDRYFEPGREVNHFTLKGEGEDLHIGVTICEDLWNDEEFWGRRSYSVNPISDLAQQGVDLTVNLSASPFTVGKQRLREAMLRHSALRFSQPVIYVNQVGGNDDLIFDGSSVAFNRRGEVVCRARTFDTDLVMVEYGSGDLLPGAIGPCLGSADGEIWSALVLGVRDYARKCGFSRAVIGLSGGIDSSLVAAIAAEALGRENILGVLMPSPYSSDHSVTDALTLADNLGIRTETLPIGDLMQGYDRTLLDLFAGTEFGIAEENIQSRIRGNLLMAIANKFGYLLLSTGNKSEMAVGYCTLYGDMNGGLAAIADVPKTRVYSICRWLNERQKKVGEGGEVREDGEPTSDSSLIPYPSSLPSDSSFIPHPSSFPSESSLIPHPSSLIPETVLTKAPSAELKPGQTDQDSLPPYEILDDILERLICDHQSPAQVVAAGHEARVVDRVFKLVTRAEFKRRQAPPVLKVTDRAFGMGWRMPIASKWIPTTPPPADPKIQEPAPSATV